MAQLETLEAIAALYLLPHHIQQLFGIHADFDGQPTPEGRLIFEIHLLCALKLRRYGPECRQSCLEHGGQGGHVFGPLDLEAILVVDGGEVFEQLGGSQHVRCHKHIDIGIEIVNRECLGKHETVWHAER